MGFSLQRYNVLRIICIFSTCNPNTYPRTTVTGAPLTSFTEKPFDSPMTFPFSSLWGINERLMEYQVPEGSGKVLALSGLT